MEEIKVEILERPRRKLILKRGIRATDYFEYCEEVGCDVWETLKSISPSLDEPVGLWLPQRLIDEGTSKYVQGVEVSLDYSKPVPDGFEIIEIDECTMLKFQGPVYDDNAFSLAIGRVWEFIEGYSPESLGYRWAYNEHPTMQLEPLGSRGYIELRPVEKL